MTEEQYLVKVEQLLNTELPTETPQELVKAITEIEAMAYLATKFQANAEKCLREAENGLIQATAAVWAEGVVGKTADERNAYVSEKTSEKILEVKKYEAKSKYYRSLAGIIERRTGLGQSILSNFSAQIKAGILVD